MNDRSSPNALALSIAAVERDTGLSKDTLRVWERRYGFPQPLRDAFGERLYPTDQVEKLRLVKRLIDTGHRPGRIVGLTVESLQSLAELASASGRSAAMMESSEDLRKYLELIKTHQIEDFRRAMKQSILRLGLYRFVVDVVAPLNVMVGDAWSRGYFEIFEEHLYTESIHIVLRGAILNIPAPVKRPRVLLTTLPSETHGIGLLMAEVVFSLEGAKCLSLGTQTPVWDVVLAAATQRADVVALSFSASQNSHFVIDSLVELRQKLPDSTEVWCGGSSPMVKRRLPPGIRFLESLREIVPAVAQWRSQHGT